MGNLWTVDVQKTELETFAECFGFFKAFNNADDIPPIWLTSYGKEIGVTADIPFGAGNFGGSYIATPACITRGPITRTMDPRDNTCEITLSGLSGSHQFLMKAVNNNYLVVVVWQHITDCGFNQTLLVGEGVPTMFSGDSLSIVVREDRRILDRLLPDIVYQKMCNNILFGRRCTLDWRAWGVQLQWGDLNFFDTADYWAGATHCAFTHPVIPGFGARYFWLGQIVVGDWATSRDRRLVGWVLEDQIGFAPAFDRKIDDGETITLVPGCNKTIEECASKFGNTANFFGFPELPTKNPATQGMF